MNARRVPDLPRPVALGGSGSYARVDILLTTLTLATVVVLTAANAAGSDTTFPVLLVLAVASTAPLLVRHRWPIPVLVLVTVVVCISTATVPLVAPVQFNSVPVTVMLAAYEVGLRHGWRIAWSTGLAAAQALLIVGETARPATARLSSHDQLSASIFALDLVLAAVGTGVLIRSRRHRLAAMEQRVVLAEEDRVAEARRQVAAERLRMAREIHDVVAHHLTLVNAQAAVAEYLLHTNLDAAAEALRGIATHSRGALDEIRSTVSLLRESGPETGSDPDGYDGHDGSRLNDLRPQAGLDALPSLLDAQGRSGAAVALTTTGEPRRLPALVDLAAYRIIQESLTNARKHAPGAAVTVVVTWTSSHLGLRIESGPVSRDEAPVTPYPGPALPTTGGGHGLTGMRERALVVGGSLTAGPTPHGGFVVHAALPAADAAGTAGPTCQTGSRT